MLKRLFIALGGLFMLVSFLTGCGKKNIADIASFRFTFSNGSMMNSGETYGLKLQNNSYTLEYKPRYAPNTCTVRTEVDKSFAKELEDILNQYEVRKWQGFDKNAKNVMDGDSFSLSVKYGQGTEVSAHGYMKWPTNYSNVKGEIMALFEKQLGANPEYAHLGDPDDYKKVNRDELPAQYPALSKLADGTDIVVVVWKSSTDSVKASIEDKALFDSQGLYMEHSMRMDVAEVKAFILGNGSRFRIISVVYKDSASSSFRVSKEEATDVENAVIYYIFE